MAKYMLIYKGEATPMDEMTPEQGADVLAKWTAWMDKVGPALADVGTPFGPSTTGAKKGARLHRVFDRRGRQHRRG
jgi:hypothetical protein